MNAALLVAVVAMLFTVLSFWWLHARRGRLTTSAPNAYAMVQASGLFRLRLPLALFNTGARAIVVRDLRCWLPDTQQVLALPWNTTRKSLRPQVDDVEDFPTAFPVRGREARTVNVEFGGPFPGFTIEGGTHRVRIESLESDHKRWRTLVEFDLHVTDNVELRGRYVAHPNELDDPEAQRRADAAARELLERLKGAASVDEPKE